MMKMKLNLSKLLLIIGIVIPCLVQATAIEQLTKLESSFDGRIGIYAINTANDETVAYRANERFPMCSTAKVMVCGTILKDSMKNPDFLQKTINYTRKDIRLLSKPVIM
jgi:beta-lactamase class A